MSNTSRRRRPSARAAGKATSVGDGISGLEAHLGYWLRFVSNHVSHAFKVKVERHGVTVAEWVVMRALFDENGIKPSHLSEKIGLTRGAISKLLERLATKGLVVVRSDVTDGRAQVITLSASGLRLVPKLAALADENDTETFGHLKEKQRAMLFSTLKSIVDHLGLGSTPVD
ncbi:MAG: MarR family transcriptional regulator [Polyangiaceae bacterium]